MAVTILSDGDRQVLAKPLEDGSIAVGLFNRGAAPLKVTVPWAMLVFDGPRQRELWRHEETGIMRPEDLRCQVRDLWRQLDVGVFPGQFTATVPPHGVVLVRATPVEQATQQHQ
jgi:alpha-galactosidase